MKGILLKCIIIVMTAALLFSMHAGCSIKESEVESDENINENLNDDVNVNENENDEVLKEVTLNFCFMYLDDRETKPDLTEVLKKIEEKTKSDINAKINFIFLERQNYSNRIKSMSASGQDIDVFFGGKGVFLFDIADLVRKDMVKDITELFPEYAPNLFSKYTPEILEAGTVDGKLIALPPLNPITYAAYAIVRSDFVKKYKVESINNYNEYKNLLIKIKENEEGVYPGYVGGWPVELFAKSNGYLILDFYSRLVYKKDDPNMGIMAWEQTPEFKDSVAMISSWYDQELLYKNSMRNTASVVRNNIGKGEIGSFLFNPGYRTGESIADWMFEINNIMKTSSYPEMQYEAFRLYPELRDQIINPIGDIWNSGSISFNAASKNVERALMFLEWLNIEQENYDLLMYGIKGKDYVLKGDGRYTLPDDFNGTSYHFNWPGRPAFVNIEMERISVGYETEQKDIYLDYIKNNAEYTGIESFHPDFSSTISEKRGGEAFMTGIADKAMTASFDMDDLDEAIEYLKDMGTDDYIKEIQKQLNEWRKEK